MKRNVLYVTLGTLTAVILAHQACSQVGFDASSSSGGGGGNGGQNCAGCDANGLLYGNSAISGLFTFQTAYNSGKVWVVTPPPTQTVSQITVDAAKTYPVKTWNYTPAGSSGGGSRTFVTPVGLVFARLPAQLFVVNDNIPTSQNLAPVWQGTNPSASGRACATAYQINGVPYVGVAWTNASDNRVFTQIPMKSTGLDVANARDVVLGNDGSGGAGWAYGCFTDQGNKIFWTATPYAGSGPLVYGVHLTTLTDVPSSSAHNAGKPVRTDAAYVNYFGDPATGSGSYALSGDAYGNVLVGKAASNAVYTFTHETKNDLTFGTGGGHLFVMPATCASGVADCTGKVTSFSEAAGGIGTGNLGPMSSLDDGRVVGISRGNPSAVYLLEPVDKNNLGAGISATAIAHITGDAYMYTDFTGATLYAQNLDNTYDLRTFSGYNPSLPIGGPSFTWNSQTGAKGEAWTGLTLTARCFNASTAATAAMAPVTVAPSGQVTSLAGLATCHPGFDHIEIAAASNGAAAYTRTITITVSARQ